MKKRDLGWFFIGFGVAFILLTFLVSFYFLNVFLPQQETTISALLETQCYSISCYDRCNITENEYREIQDSCEAKTAYALEIAKSQMNFFILIFQNYGWILVIGVIFLIIGLIIFRAKK